MRTPETNKKRPARLEKRKPYQPPRLREYGTLAQLVRLPKGGATVEGPTTKAGMS